jgi:Xaa-Pro aminopeptidase
MHFPEHYKLVPETEVSSRLERLAVLLEAEAALVSWPADLFYLTGSNQFGYLLIPNDKEPLFLVRRTPERAAAESPVRVASLEGFRELGDMVRDHLGRAPKRLALALDTTPVREARSLAELLGEPEISDLGPLLLSLRAIKSPWEIEQLEEAGRIGSLAYSRLPSLFRPGMTELALAGAVTSCLMELGSQVFTRSRSAAGEMYPYHLVSGKNGLRRSRVEAPFGGLGQSPSFPQGPSLEPIQPGVPILADLASCWQGYIVDVTRMFSWGPPPKRALEAHQALRTIEADLMDRLRPGVQGEEVFEATVALARELGFGLEFLGQGRSANTFVAHGVGLEISEPPYVAQGRPEIIQAHQALALELKMVLPGLGAVGIEDTVVVTESGARTLTPHDQRFIDLTEEGGS